MTHGRRRPPSAARAPQIRNVTLLAHFDTHNIYKRNGAPSPPAAPLRKKGPPSALFSIFPPRDGGKIQMGGPSPRPRRRDGKPAPRLLPLPPVRGGEDTDGGSSFLSAGPAAAPATKCPKMSHFDAHNIYKRKPLLGCAAPLSLFPPSAGGRYRWGVFLSDAAPKAWVPRPPLSLFPRSRGEDTDGGSPSRTAPNEWGPRPPLLLPLPPVCGGKIQMGGLPSHTTPTSPPSYIIGKTPPWRAPSNHERSFIRQGPPGRDEKPGTN